ncbi:hypothetical protein C2857_004578 [Epichloe festucae Fl1]|uniref:Uncharacterized protein n=1 Tax=Epichloe festucae (strain Fl1) TaxID=877507 RepID=A0A7U3Q1Q8_EPIFF|nr:hypothetical protein C2857_004578 [Epichloe festucae Fl1]
MSVVDHFASCHSRIILPFRFFWDDAEVTATRSRHSFVASFKPELREAMTTGSHLGQKACSKELAPITDLIVRHHERLRNPFSWTSADLEIAGCRFGEVETCAASAFDSSQQCDQDDMSKTVQKLATARPLKYKELLVENLLRDEFKRDR